MRIDASGNAIADADGLFSICPQGLAGTRGVFIWHNDDYSAITYSTTLYGPQTAIVGNVDSAVTCITLDQRGTDRTSRITPGVGAVATSAEQSSLIVTTGLDQSNPYDGLTSLREALAYAATLGGTPEITFDIPGNDTVILNSALDTIDSSLTIDGYNQATENDVTISVESQGVIQNNSGEWEVNPAGSQFRVFSIANETPEIILVKLSNLSIIGGNISAGGESRDGYGACIWAVGSGAIQLSLDHVELRQGYAYAGGGLHYCSPSNLEIKNSTFINNFATFGGGILIGVQNSIGDMNVQVTDSLFLGNYSESNGGAIRAGSCNLTVERSEFEQTRSTSSVILLGGTSGEYLITDSLFHNNVDEAITQRYDTTTVNLRNVTLAKNGGSAKLLNGSLLNSILWGNNEKDLVVTDKVTVAYNAIEGWNKGGPGNITLQSENNGTDAPGVYYANFVDPTSGDYRLVANSYLINRGDNSAISAGAMDLAKDSRLQYGYVDIGAYETAGKGNIVIDFTAPETLIYGDSASISASHDGRDSGTIAYESANTEAVLVAGTTITAVKASESSVLSATVAESTNWNSASATRTVTTQKRSITVTADAQTKVYGEADPQLTYQVTGLVGDDTLAGSLEREAGEDVGEYAITQGTLANSNYNINFSGAVLTITAKEITIDLADPNFHYAIDSKVYDGNTTVTGAELSVVIGGETVALIWTDGQFNSKDVVSVTDATFTGLTSANSNYVLSADRVTVDAAGKITAKDITVTADAQTKVYGSADPELTYQVDGLIGNDTLAGSLTRAVGEDVGEYAILQGTLANSNYKINFTGANLTITAKSDVVVKPSGLNFDQYSEAVNPNFSALHPALTGRGLASVGLFSRLNENVYAMNHSALHAHLELRNGLRGSINNETASGRAVLPIDHSMMTIDAPLKNHSGFLFSRTMVMKLEALANGKEIMIDSSFAELRHMENTSAEKTHSSWHFLPESVKLPRSFFIDDVPADELPDPAYDLRGIRAELPRRADAFKSELELLLEELVGA